MVFEFAQACNIDLLYETKGGSLTEYVYSIKHGRVNNVSIEANFLHQKSSEEANPSAGLSNILFQFSCQSCSTTAKVFSRLSLVHLQQDNGQHRCQQDKIQDRFRLWPTVSKASPRQTSFLNPTRSKTQA